LFKPRPNIFPSAHGWGLSKKDFAMRSSYLSFVLFLSFMVAFSLFSPGCESTSADRIAMLQDGLQLYQDESIRLDTDLQELKTVIAETQAELDQPDLTSDVTVKLQEFLDESIVAMETIAAQKIDVDAKLAAWQEKIDEITAQGNPDFGTELQVVGEGAKEIAPALPPPFNTIAYLGGTFLLTLGGIWSKRKIGTLVTDSRALAEVVKGNEIFKNSIDDPGALTAFKTAHVAAQTDTTAAVVAARRIPLKNKIAAPLPIIQETVIKNN